MISINNKTLLDSCPLCRSTDICKIDYLGYKENLSFSTHIINLLHTPELWKCRSCDSRFVQNMINAEAAETLYSSGQAGNRWSTTAFDQIKTQEVVDEMLSLFKNKLSVLDVGSNTGELLDFASEQGCKTTGVEFSQASRELLKEKGHKAYANFEDTSDKYDLITAFDLVEHLYNVPAFLKDCHEKLNDGGMLVILTGNVGSISAKIAGSAWWYAQYPEHIVFPSKDYFSALPGFKIEKWITTYASKGYKHSIYRVVLEFMKTILRGRKYVGIPSLGADHVLLILKK